MTADSGRFAQQHTFMHKFLAVQHLGRSPAPATWSSTGRARSNTGSSTGRMRSSTGQAQAEHRSSTDHASLRNAKQLSKVVTCGHASARHAWTKIRWTRRCIPEKKASLQDLLSDTLVPARDQLRQLNLCFVSQCVPLVFGDSCLTPALLPWFMIAELMVRDSVRQDRRTVIILRGDPLDESVTVRRVLL